LNKFEKPSPEARAAVDAAITSRHSMRAFLSTEVPRETIEEILQIAARAPSGTNTQPWQVHVLTGRAKERLSERIIKAHADPVEAASHREEYAYYPSQWASPYIDRRRKVGWDLYGLLGLGKTDKEGMHKQHARNYRFFDAPVGLMFSIDRMMQQGSWLDYGMFLQNIMVAARARGLHTCPQAAWNGFSKIILPHIGASDGEMLVCGMALGYADATDVVNTLHTPRVPAAEFTHWLA
jgi:nitroreductase